MGVIRVIIFSLIFFQPFFVKSQTIKDTIVIDGDLYIEHLVNVGESLKKIANMYNIRVKDIVDANEMSGKLYYNQILYIPFQSKDNSKLINSISNLTNKFNDIEKEEIHIALLMPYYIIKNDTMFNGFEDTTKIPFIYYNPSDVALSFHIGVELAIDSLRRSGKIIYMSSYDTNNDSLKTNQIVNSGVLDNIDIIIGPLHAKNFSILCNKYGNNSDKIIINPLSRLTDNVAKYKSVYQISTPNKEQAMTIKNKIIRSYKNKKVMIMYHEKEKGLASYIHHLFKKENQRVHFINIEHTHVDSVRRYFDDFQIVILPSSDHAFVTKMLASIGGIDSTSIVFGLDIWKNYDNLDVEDLMEIDVHFPIYNIFNYNNIHDRAFLTLFENEYNTNQGKYTHIAYNIIMHFCSDFKFFFFKRFNNGGKINIRSPLYHYIDYELVPAK